MSDNISRRYWFWFAVSRLSYNKFKSHPSMELMNEVGFIVTSKIAAVFMPVSVFHSAGYRSPWRLMTVDIYSNTLSGRRGEVRLVSGQSDVPHGQRRVSETTSPHAHTILQRCKCVAGSRCPKRSSRDLSTTPTAKRSALELSSCKRLTTRIARAAAGGRCTNIATVTVISAA